jgi:hypothetical protein
MVMRSTTKKVRVQLDLRNEEARSLDELRRYCAGGSRADAVRTALAVVEWVREEISQGRRILALGREDVSYLVVPGLTNRTSAKEK